MNVETIVLKELGIGYPSKNGVRVVAEHINGAIRSGELTCLLGANGVGKSTLLRTLSAFQPKIAGEILFAENDGLHSREISEMSDKELANWSVLEGLLIQGSGEPIRKKTCRSSMSR